MYVNEFYFKKREALRTTFLLTVSSCNIHVFHFNIILHVCESVKNLLAQIGNEQRMSD